jgi:O-antigen ligase
MLGALAAFLWLALRKRAFPFVQGSVVAIAILIVAALATLAENPWAERKLHGFAERVGSLIDFPGNRNYQSEESSMKGGNNQFRAMWWRAVIDETISRNPALGLGFGYDLARNFLQEYNPAMGDDFTARSPHSILVTTFGRMGLLGLGVFACFIGALFVRTWRIMRNVASPPVELSLWACVWVILVSACFGVVLEGPMGAVVFWTLLGLANASPRPEPDDALPAPTAEHREPGNYSARLYGSAFCLLGTKMSPEATEITEKRDH